MVPTINESSYSDSETGIVNTVIAPIREMVGDTMKIKLTYTHSITEKEEGSMFFSDCGRKSVQRLGIRYFKIRKHHYNLIFSVNTYY